MIKIIVRFQKYDQSFKKYEFVKHQINDESRFHQIPTISQHFLLFLNEAEFWKVQQINRK